MIIFALCDETREETEVIVSTHSQNNNSSPTLGINLITEALQTLDYQPWNQLAREWLYMFRFFIGYWI
jgi:hypothetical protein